MKNRNVQIPYELFFQLLQYFLMENYVDEESMHGIILVVKFQLEMIRHVLNILQVKLIDLKHI